MMSEINPTEVDSTLIDVVCPLCGTAGGTPLLPSAKRDELGDTFHVHEEIMLSLCENCGLVFENPQIKLLGSTEYAEKNYYTITNTAWNHDDVQHAWSFYNWWALKDALPWDGVFRAMDVGAAGAWSNTLVERVPHLKESVLVEPSPRAIFNCEVRYPKVRAELGVFEAYEDDRDKFDLITFFNSFYSVSDPLSALRKVNALLRPGGYLVMCFSIVGMDLEFWDNGNPWVHMSHVVRGVPIIYYSAKTYRALLAQTGFEVTDDLVFEIPDCDLLGQAGRQINFVVAKAVREPAGSIDPNKLNDKDEVERSRQFYTKFCEDVTKRSLKLFFERNNPAKLSVVHDGDEAYGQWVSTQIATFGRKATLINGAAMSFESLPDRLGDNEGEIVLLAGNWSKFGDTVKSLFQSAEVINCSPLDSYWGYGNWVKSPDGNVVITRSFCPCQSLGDAIFPFDKRTSMNTRDLSPEELELKRRPVVYFPQSVDDVPYFAGEVAKLALTLSPDERQALLRPYFEQVEMGMAEDSIIAISKQELPSGLELPPFESLIETRRISTIRPIVQWALLLGSIANFEKSISDFNATIENLKMRD